MRQRGGAFVAGVGEAVAVARIERGWAAQRVRTAGRTTGRSDGVRQGRGSACGSAVSVKKAGSISFRLGGWITGVDP